MSLSSPPLDPRPTIQINTDALRDNLAYVREVIGPRRRLYAVVKADAYGHGVDIVAPAVAGQVDGFVVATLDEAFALRALSALRSATLLTLQPIDPALQSISTIEAAVAEGITLAPGSVAGVRAIAAAARRVGRFGSIQLHVDTGLRRCGVDLGDADAMASEVLRHPSLGWEHLSTHGAMQDVPDHPATIEQLRVFRDVVARWKPKVPTLIAHAAASGWALLCPAARMDAVRIGAAMYGIDPRGASHPNRPLRPAMRLTAPVLLVRDLRPGDGVGYGHTFVADRAMRVAVLPVGYFDGLPRTASNRACVRIDDETCPVLGTVSMDSIVIDVSRCPHARVGTVATVVDDEPGSPASAHALATAAGTVSYEIVSRMGSRARRIAVGSALQPVRPVVQLQYVRPTAGRGMRHAV